MLTYPNYKAIVDHYESCLARHGDSHLGVDWPNQKDAETRYAVMLEVVRDKDANQTLLDFGCGTSHLYAFMKRAGLTGLKYHGLDISSAFCALSQSKYPENQYQCLDVLERPHKLGIFDYVVMNGVFTEKRNLSFVEMFGYFKDTLRAVFPKVRIGLAFNVMSKAVAWERDDLFHLPMDDLAKFITSELSRHFLVRHDYGLFEYTVYVYKEPAVV